MTKNEVIEKAYGHSYEDMKNFIDGNGWLTEMHTSIYYRTTEDGKMLSSLMENSNIIFEEVNNYLRPESLSGIENNNGWIRIDSEADLPENGISCFFMVYDQIKTGIFDYRFKNKGCSYGWGTVTHYQPIQKPHQPLY